MDALWLSMGITHDGFPMVHPDLRDLTSLALENSGSLRRMMEKLWVSDPVSGAPLVASKRAQSLTYGEDHWAVSPFFLLLSS